MTVIVQSISDLFCLNLTFEDGRPVFPAGRIVLCLFCSILTCATCGCGGNGTSKPLATVDGMTISISEFYNGYAREVNSLHDRSSLTP